MDNVKCFYKIVDFPAFLCYFVAVKDFVVFKDIFSYCAFPWICRLNTEQYAVTFRLAPQRSFIQTHIDPKSQIAVLVSDNPLDWSRANLFVVPDSFGGGQYPSLNHLGDDNYLILDFRYKLTEDDFVRAVRSNGELADICSMDGVFAVDARFEGGTFHFGESRRVLVDGLEKMSTSGGLIPGNDGGFFLAVDSELPDGRGKCSLLVTYDSGKTWSVRGTLVNSPCPDMRFVEPAVARRDEKNLVCLFRTEKMDGYTYIAFSSDDGVTWTKPIRTPLQGCPAQLKFLLDGRLLAIYGRRIKPFGVRACWSEDRGITWRIHREIYLRENALGPDMGYPCAVQLDDGSMLCVYYYFVEDGLRHIAATHFNLF